MKADIDTGSTRDIRGARREAVCAHLGPWEGGKWALLRVASCQDGALGGVDDPPGGACRHAHEPLPELTVAAPAAPEKSERRRQAENWLFRGARLAGQVVGGSVAGLAGGLAGAALGGYWGWQAGVGTLERLNARLGDTYGDTKVQALEKLQAPLVAAGNRVRQSLGKVAGAVAGSVSGAALGLLGGALFSYRFFGGFAGLAAQNLVKESVGELPVHYRTEQILQRGYRS